jgi:hypothetical protein
LWRQPKNGQRSFLDDLEPADERTQDIDAMLVPGNRNPLISQLL